jgi:hypothetical protein
LRKSLLDGNYATTAGATCSTGAECGACLRCVSQSDFGVALIQRTPQSEGLVHARARTLKCGFYLIAKTVYFVQAWGRRTQDRRDLAPCVA